MFLKIASMTTTSVQRTPIVYSGTGTAIVLAVKGDTGEGEIGHVIVQITPGEGRILANTNPFVEPDTQMSVETAVVAALDFTGKLPDGMDFIVTFDTNATLIGGPSAGGAISIATLAALEHKEVRQDVAMTGGIDENGNILPVGGLVEKITVAAKQGIKTVLIPDGQGNITVYETTKETQTIGDYQYVRITIVPKKIDLIKYGQDALNIKVREVSTIDEAAGYLLN